MSTIILFSPFFHVAFQLFLYIQAYAFSELNYIPYFKWTSFAFLWVNIASLKIRPGNYLHSNATSKIELHYCIIIIIIISLQRFLILKKLICMYHIIIICQTMEDSYKQLEHIIDH